MRGQYLVMTWEEPAWSGIEPSRTLNVMLVTIACWGAAALCLAASATTALFPDCASDTCVSPAGTLRQPSSWNGPLLQRSISLRLAVAVGLLVVSAVFVVISVAVNFGHGTPLYIASSAAFLAVAAVLALTWVADAPSPPRRTIIPRGPATPTTLGRLPVGVPRPVGLPPPTTVPQPGSR